jgi:general nucleoside transport system permease protein
MTAPTAAHTSPAGEAPPEPRLPGPVRLLREVLPYVLALLLAFLVSGIVIAALGYDAIEAFRTILSTSFRTGFGFTETLTKWVPLVLLALGFTIPLAVGRFNIGGEGQLLVGATAAAGVGIVYADLPTAVLLPFTLVAGVLAGAVWAGIAALLMGRFGVNEILSTVLLNFVSFQVLDYAATKVWSDPAAGVAATRSVGEGAQLPTIGGPPGVHAGILLAVLVSLATIVVTRRTAAGFELRASGLNPRAAAINGIRVGRIAVVALIIGGALGGLAGALEVSGVHGRAIEGMQSNFLLLGIIIGLIARGSALWVPAVAFGIAILEVGASSMQRTVGVPAEMVLIIEALILIFLLLSDVIAGRLARRVRT